jgi:hypothetical protein
VHGAERTNGYRFRILCILLAAPICRAVALVKVEAPKAGLSRRSFSEGG